MATNYPNFFPIIYHDIQLEIPRPFQGICRRYYYGWMFFVCGGSFIDIIASIIFFASLPPSAQMTGLAVHFVGLRVLHFLLISSIYFWFLYWPLYKALKTNNSFAWLVFWISNSVYIVWLSIMASGVWPGELRWALIGPPITLMFFASIADKAIWALSIAWWIFSTMRIYMVYHYEAASVHAKLATDTELDKMSKERPAVAKKSFWDKPSATTKVAGQDVTISVDPKTAASVAKTAYTSGAAGELAAGTKAKVGPDGTLSYEVDPKAAQKAATTMYSSGAASQLASGTTVSSGGWGWGGSRATTAASPPPLPEVKERTLKVVHDFTGQEQGDLTIKVGDRVTFVRTVDENWVEGTLNGKRGIFPSKFATDV